MVNKIYGLCGILLFSAPSLLLAVTASPGELHATREWVAANILSTPLVNARHELPFHLPTTVKYRLNLLKSVSVKLVRADSILSGLKLPSLTLS